LPVLHGDEPLVRLVPLGDDLDAMRAGREIVLPRTLAHHLAVDVDFALFSERFDA